MRGYDSNVAMNISAPTAEFSLRGGLYMTVISATFGGGSVALQALSADLVTWVDAHTARTTNGINNLSLPPGKYRWNVITATAVYASVAGLAGD